MVEHTGRYEYTGVHKWAGSNSPTIGRCTFSCCGLQQPWDQDWVYHTVNVWSGILQREIAGEVWCEACCVKKGVLW